MIYLNILFSEIYKIFFLLLPVLVSVALIVWLDRRVWAFVQKRKGPNVVGPFGLFQTLADALKYIFKEIIIPASSNKIIFILAPIITLTLALIAWAVIPFGNEIVLANINRNTILDDKMVEHFMKAEKISEVKAGAKLNELTPLAQIVLDAKPIAKIEPPKPAVEGKKQVVTRDGEAAVPGPIDIEYKDKMDPSASFKTKTGNELKTWGRVGTDNKVMGVWGEFCSVDFDICIGDGACIDACPVAVYEFLDFPGNAGSTKKPVQINEPDCIFCLACEGVCPPQAIKIYPQ